MEKRYYWLGHGEPSDQDKFFLEALDSTLWEAGTEENWDTCWNIGMPDSDVFHTLSPQQTINHIPGNSALTIKSSLYETLESASARLQGTAQENRYHFYPETYLMPQDYFAYQERASQNPDWLWIQKPKNLSRGRGIEVVKHPTNIPVDDEWLIQRYLSDPHLYNGHKYVLRCYVLITSVEPLRFYWYQEGFCKLASEVYSLDDLDDLYKHLTNPDINEENSAKEKPVTFYSFTQYKQWLNQSGHDSEQLFDQLKDLITLTVIAAREKMRRNYNSEDPVASGCYELIGLDCMVDNDLKPWILECNLSPSLSTYAVNDDGGDCETTIKRAMVHDLVNLLGFNNKKVISTLSEQERIHWETNHCGQFECLFPNKNINQYIDCFPVPRHKDIYLLPPDISINEKAVAIPSDITKEFAFEDSLALLPGENHQSPIAPNDMASWIWLKNAEGLTPSAIADELAEMLTNSQHPNPIALKNDLLSQVYDVLADWGQAGMFAKPVSSITNIKNKQYTFCLSSHYCTLEIKTSCHLAAEAIATMTAKQTGKSNQPINVTILRSKRGYFILQDDEIIGSEYKLSEILPVLFDILSKHSANIDSIVHIHGSLLQIGNTHTLIINQQHKSLDDTAYKLSQEKDNLLLSASVSINTKNRQVTTTNEPLFLTEKTAQENNQCNGSIVEIYQTCGHVLTLPTNHNTYNVDEIVFINNNVDCKSEITSAESLTALYNHIRTPHAHTVHNGINIQLAQWLAGINSFNTPEK